jgi:signal transduction histidine kinase
MGSTKSMKLCGNQIERENPINGNRRFGKSSQPGTLNRLASNVSTDVVVDTDPEIETILVVHRPRRKSLVAETTEEVQATLAHARQSAVLAERNRLAGEIHDGLAQFFTGISMQLSAAREELSAKEGDPLCSIQRAIELANFGLAEARRCTANLRLGIVEESGLAVALRHLVERSSVPGRLRCDLRSDNIPEDSLPPKVQHALLRIAQEAIHNAMRHAKPNLIVVSLRWDPPNLVLQVSDNGSGISAARLEKNEGFGLGNMRARASEIDGRFEIRTAADHGTTIIVTVPRDDFSNVQNLVPTRSLSQNFVTRFSIST